MDKLKKNLKWCFIEMCAFSYSSASSALYAFSFLQVIDALIDIVDKKEIDTNADIIQTIVCLILICQLFIANQYSLKAMITELFEAKSSNSASSSASWKYHVKKFSTIGGTYVKTFSTSASLISLLLTYFSRLPRLLAFTVGGVLAPFNAVAQFSIIGKKYSKELLYNAGFAIIEDAILTTTVYYVIYIKHAHKKGSIVITTAGLGLFSEMITLTFFNKSIFCKIISSLKACLFPQKKELTSSLLTQARADNTRSREISINTKLTDESAYLSENNTTEKSENETNDRPFVL